MPWLHQECLFNAANPCREKSTSCLTAASADLLLPAPQTTLSEQGAHPAAPRGLGQLLSCRSWGACGHGLTPCPGAAVRRAARIPLPRGRDPHPPPAHALDLEVTQQLNQLMYQAVPAQTSYNFAEKQARSLPWQDAGAFLPCTQLLLLCGLCSLSIPRRHPGSPASIPALGALGPARGDVKAGCLSLGPRYPPHVPDGAGAVPGLSRAPGAG